MPSKQITLEAIEQIRRLSPKRRRLSDSSDICRLEDGTCFVSLRFPSLVRLFRSDTQIGLSPYPASAGCATAAGSRRTRLAPPSRVPVLS